MWQIYVMKLNFEYVLDEFTQNIEYTNFTIVFVHIDNLVLMHNLLCDIHSLLITINRSLSVVSIEFTFHSWLNVVFEQLLIFNVWHFWNSNNSKINKIFTKRHIWVSNQLNHATKVYNHQVVKVLLDYIFIITKLLKFNLNR